MTIDKRQLAQAYWQILDPDTGEPWPGAQVYTYEAGTTTPTTTWTDASGLTPNTNPIIADSEGRVSIWVPPIVDPEQITPGGGSAEQFIQEGAGATARTYLSKCRDIISVKDFGAVGDGVTDDTAAIEAACSSRGNVGVYLPEGDYVVDGLVIPDTCRALFGDGDATLYITRRSYSLYEPAIKVDANGNLILAGFIINGNDTLLTNATLLQIDASVDVKLTNIEILAGMTDYGAAVQFKDSHQCKATNVNVYGSCGAAVYATGACWDLTWSDSTVRGSGSGVITCALMLGTADTSYGYVAKNITMEGIFQYGIMMSVGGYGNTTDGCTARPSTQLDGFMFGIEQANGSIITNCHASNSKREAFQITDASYCTIANNQAEYDTGGTDFGISINGRADICFGNKIFGNSIVNSYIGGIGLADNVVDSQVYGNTLINCGVRYEDDNPGDGYQMVLYTEAEDSAINASNFVWGNYLEANSGPVQYGILEQNKATGTPLVRNRYKYNNFGINDQSVDLYGILAQGSRIWHDNYIAYTPTITASTGTLTTTTVTRAGYRPDGDQIELDYDITVTDAGSGAAFLQITTPVGFTSTRTYAGVLPGREVTGGKMLQGEVDSSGVTRVANYDNTTAIATGARVVMQGNYQL